MTIREAAGSRDLAEIRTLVEEYARSLEIDLESGSTKIRRYWTPLAAAAAESARSDGEWEDRVEAAIKRAVRGQLMSDVPLGAFLSGGVDSSLVVAAMGTAETFSIGFDDPTYDETRWSRRVADHLKVNHHVEIIRPDVGDLFAHLMQFMDDPIGFDGAWKAGSSSDTSTWVTTETAWRSIASRAKSFSRFCARA